MEPEAMTGTGACAEIRLELGVYVLGVIGGADRSVVDAHLACCANCREELAELAGLPPLLSWATLDDADGLLYRDGCRDGGREHSAHRVPRSLLAGCKRHRAAPHRACRAITRQQGGESAR
jgi:anti-sigma factor RsiW